MLLEKMIRVSATAAAALTILFLFAIITGCGSDSSSEFPIKGTLSYDSAATLPDNATARVSLVERGNDKADKRIVAERSLHDLGQPPIKFELQVGQHLINPDGRYGMRAVILDAQGHNLWHTRGVVPLDPRASNITVSLDLKPADRPLAQGQHQFRCEDGYRFAVVPGGDDKLVLSLGKRRLVLNAVADGEKQVYTDMHGNRLHVGETDSDLRIDGNTHNQCRRDSDEANNQAR